MWYGVAWGTLKHFEVIRGVHQIEEFMDRETWQGSKHTHKAAHLHVVCVSSW